MILRFKILIRMKEDKSINFKKKFLDYIDISFAFLHFILIIFPLIMIYEYMIVTIIGCIIATVFLVAIIYTFIRDNPFFIYYCYGLFFLGFFFLMASLLIIPLLVFIIIPQLIYIYNLMKNARQFELPEGFVTGVRETNRYGAIAYYHLLNSRDVVTTEDKLLIKQQKKNLNEKFHVNTILGITLILTISLFIIYVFVGKIIYMDYHL